MREKEEWRFATMEYGGQCVTMAGIKWTQTLFVDSLDTEDQVRRAKWKLSVSVD